MYVDKITQNKTTKIYILGQLSMAPEEGALRSWCFGMNGFPLLVLNLVCETTRKFWASNK